MPLTLANLQLPGLRVELKALLTVVFEPQGNTATLYAGPPRSPVGVLHDDSDIGLGPGNDPLTRLRVNTNGSRITLNDNTGSLNLGQYFGSGGARA